jgi:regulator of sigma E protease
LLNNITGLLGLSSIADFVIYVALPFILLLGFCITIHELGHFVMAKAFHIPVEKFSIGYGPPIISRKIGETDFRIAYFPLGGYVKMAGEEEGVLVDKEDDKGDVEPGFYDAATYKRILVVFAGPFFNIASAVLIFFLSFTIFGLLVNPYMKIEVDQGSMLYEAGLRTGDSIIAVENTQVYTWEGFWEVSERSGKDSVRLSLVRNGDQIALRIPFNDSTEFTPHVPPILGSVQINGPAHKAGMKPGDRVLSINGVAIDSWYEMVDIVRESEGKELEFVWLHEDSMLTALVIPAATVDPLPPHDTVGQIHAIQPLVREHISPFATLALSVQRTAGVIWLTLKTFYQLIVGKISRKALGGPIAIFRLSGESARWGFEYLLGLMAIISVNLGLINLFPVPALDGGHILIATVESIIGRRFSKQTRLVIQQIGYAIILLLIIFVTFNDITR